MFAIVEIKGQQFKVSPKDKLQINRIETKEGEDISFRRVLLVAEGEKVEIGKPYLTTYEVTAKVLEHFRNKTVRVFKMKSKSRNHKTIGNRQHYTNIEILDIKTAGAKPTVKTEEKPAKEAKPAAPKVKKSTKTAA
ncbi:MAG: 50S ribosomal protein L21, large subunit ribosomal protein L21 [Candidatus Peregrinibacteria bacterium GW2011_GWF2_38_29]|nr:MAG: 50S ribosomal protein L21, large subunit ribosomal protein L21 [Candidatus Peregrinibacteria bacterium GW2011_GWF2_38_29]HBB02982.1 50S ribosomal protein L21 [Candidatus Peregrinibacteria bacterium]